MNRETLILILCIFLTVLLSAEERHYPAKVISVHDGDTLDVEIVLEDVRLRRWSKLADGTNLDLGLGLSFHHQKNGYGTIMKKERIRLLGLDAPELKTGEGKEVAGFMQGFLEGRTVSITTENDKREKYGRLLAVVDIDGTNVNRFMLIKELAKPYDGGKRTP